MLTFVCDCTGDITLRFRVPRDRARFRLFRAGTAPPIATSPDNDGSWDTVVPHVLLPGTFKLEVTIASQGGDAQPADMTVDDSTGKDLDPANKKKEQRDPDGWRLGVTNVNAASIHLFNILHR